MAAPARVLIVDDDPEDVELVSQILQAAGYEVRSASDTRSGLRTADQERFEVVVLDHRFNNSPIVGISVVSEFARRSAAGVVMLTAFGDEDLEKDARMLGAAAYLTKPVDSEALVRTIARLIAQGQPGPPPCA